MMNFNYHKMEYRGSDDGKEVESNSRILDDSKLENGRMYYNCRKDLESEFKSTHGQPKDGAVAPKPSDVRNGDLVSLLLAATPPYLYNIPLIPQTFFFSEMLKSFVQAKTERQNLKAQQTHHRRQRKRSWREMTPPKPVVYETNDKPLELTTPRQSEEKQKIPEKSPSKKYNVDSPEKKHQTLDFGSSNFTAEKLANSSIPSNPVSESSNVGSEIMPPTPPVWYPSLYPPHPPYGIDPLHFFIDLRVSAHVWDRKLAADKLNNESALPSSPLNLHNGSDSKESAEKTMPVLEPTLSKNRHNSAFSVPLPRKETVEEPPIATKKSPQSVHYVMSNIKNIYKPRDKTDEEEVEEEEEKEKVEEEEKPQEEEGGKEGKDEKKCKDLRALIGLELVVDYVKQESDVSEDEDQASPDQVSKDQPVCIKE